jgi:hypothetical protein
MCRTYQVLISKHSDHDVPEVEQTSDMSIFTGHLRYSAARTCNIAEPMIVTLESTLRV